MRYGIKSVSMDDIAKQLGISKKTLYQYVDNKSDLITKVMEFHIETEQKAIAEIHDVAKDPIHEMLLIARFVSRLLREMNPATVYDLQKYYADSWQIMQKLQNEHIYGIIKENLY